MVTNTIEIGTALLPLRRVTRPARTAVSPRAPIPVAFALAVLAVLATAAPEQAAAQTVTTFISNTGQTISGRSNAVRATKFTTGTGIYPLSTVRIELGIQASPLTPLVQIYGDTGGNPGTLVATMTNPDTIVDSAVNIFTAPANTALSTNTPYFVVTSNFAVNSGTGLRVATTDAPGLDRGAAAGWSLGSARFKDDIAASWDSTTLRHRFQIRGTEVTAPKKQPTVANAIPDQTATAGTAFSYAFPDTTFNDADTGQTLSYMATKADGMALPTWLAFTAGTRTFAGTPAASDVGTVSVKVTASDGNGGSVSDTFNITFGSLEVDFGTASDATVKVREGPVPHRLTMVLDSEPQRPVTIPLVVTHVGGATEVDYTDLPESVTFAAGKMVAGFDIRAIPDQTSETGEGLRLDFGDLPPGVTQGTWGPYEMIAFVDAAAQVKPSVAGPLLTLGYPGALDGGSQPSPRDFVVSAETPGGARAMVAVTAVSVRGSDVFLDLDRPVRPDETVTLTYLAAAMHPIRDAAGLSAPPLADEPVRNDTNAPVSLAEAAPVPLAALLEAAREGAGTERLDLSSRNLTDISALAGLTGVVELDLRDNAITDLSPLAGLTQLRALDLAGNRIADLWPLAGLAALEQLDLSDNRVADIATLAGLAAAARQPGLERGPAGAAGEPALAVARPGHGSGERGIGAARRAGSCAAVDREDAGALSAGKAGDTSGWTQTWKCAGRQQVSI